MYSHEPLGLDPENHMSYSRSTRYHIIVTL
jgi:hypothetical protein